MTWLGVDVGNSHTVVGLFIHDRLISQWRLSTHPVSTSDEWHLKVAGILDLAGYHWSDLRALIVSSVVPKMTERLKDLATPVKKFFIDHTSPFSFSIDLDRPEQVGADRLVNAEAAWRAYGSPTIIVDSGTATTLCALNQNGYQGGAIMPGIEGSIETLAMRAAQLSVVELKSPPQSIGRNTQEAVQSGVLFGYASMIRGMISRFQDELGGKATVVATGGVSRKLAGLMPEIKHFDSDLTMKGLAFLAERLLYPSSSQGLARAALETETSANVLTNMQTNAQTKNRAEN